MSAINVETLTKIYPSFKLDGISFEVKEGRITGFIGRNGAGKTTTLGCLINLIHPDSGRICFFGKEFSENEGEIKEQIGFVTGSFEYYPLKKIKTITRAVSGCYKNWDEEKYRQYILKFGLDEEKKPSQLSDGMRVKYSIALALSHGARLLIMDEPTSGLDPLSREELCDLLLALVREEGVTVLFSTHITSDLEKVADDIIYINNGRILASGTLERLSRAYRKIFFENKSGAEALGKKIIGLKSVKNGYEGLIRLEDCDKNLKSEPADLDSVMVHFGLEEKGDKH